MGDLIVLAALHLVVVESVSAVKTFSGWGKHPVFQSPLARYLDAASDNLKSSLLYVVALALVARLTGTIFGVTGVLKGLLVYA